LELFFLTTGSEDPEGAMPKKSFSVKDFLTAYSGKPILVLSIVLITLFRFLVNYFLDIKIAYFNN
jgi:hypothetical protein